MLCDISLCDNQNGFRLSKPNSQSLSPSMAGQWDSLQIAATTQSHADRASSQAMDATRKSGVEFFLPYPVTLKIKD